MAQPTFALVGSAGTVSVGASGASVTPAYGQSPTALNLLVLWTAVQTGSGAASVPATPSGWTLGEFAVGVAGAAVVVFWKIAVGGDSAPTVAGLASSIISARLAEFSGNSLTPADTGGVGAGTGATLIVTADHYDQQGGDLVISGFSESYSVAGTKTLTVAGNNGQSLTTVTSAGSSTVAHYVFSYSTTGNTSSTYTGFDAVTLTQTTTNILGSAGVVFSFFLKPASTTEPYVFSNTSVAWSGNSVTSYSPSAVEVNAGDIVFLHHFGNGSTVASVTDNFTPHYAWSLVKQATNGPIEMEVWVGVPPQNSPPSGLMAATVALNAADTAEGNLYVVSGPHNPLTPVESAAITTGTTSTAQSTSIVPQVVGDLVIHFLATFDNVTVNPSLSSWAYSITLANTSGLQWGGAAWANGTAGVALPVSWTVSGSDFWIVASVVVSATTGSSGMLAVMGY